MVNFYGKEYNGLLVSSKISKNFLPCSDGIWSLRKYKYSLNFPTKFFSWKHLANPLTQKQDPKVYYEYLQRMNKNGISFTSNSIMSYIKLVLNFFLFYSYRQIIPLVILEEGSYEKDVLFYVNIGEPQMIGGKFNILSSHFLLCKQHLQNQKF